MSSIIADGIWFLNDSIQRLPGVIWGVLKDAWNNSPLVVAFRKIESEFTPLSKVMDDFWENGSHKAHAAYIEKTDPNQGAFSRKSIGDLQTSMDTSIHEENLRKAIESTQELQAAQIYHRVSMEPKYAQGTCMSVIDPDGSGYYVDYLPELKVYRVTKRDSMGDREYAMDISVEVCEDSSSKALHMAMDSMEAKVISGAETLKAIGCWV